ncbi:uncharacterized protein LOC133706171 [Populus nigra]|uniref:uncharacterized protein LOC133706171 n=1 Tax=Populus nigra TaxID=3691 RepID=UPI002B26BACA|nr:uncharacterized protein LOC133706171 [Populus nigra]
MSGMDKIKHQKRGESPFVYLTSIVRKLLLNIMVPMSLSCWKPAINDENPDVSQAAVYGIGICAGLGGSGSMFKPLAGGTFQVQCCNKSSQCTSFGQYNAILTMLFQLLEKYASFIGIA